MLLYGAATQLERAVGALAYGVNECADGLEKHFNHFPAEWAWAMSAPFQWTKQVASHPGGVRNPMIIKWPAKIKEHHSVHSQSSHVIDIASTIEQPVNVNGTAQKPIEGRSFLYFPNLNRICVAVL